MAKIKVPIRTLLSAKISSRHPGAILAKLWRKIITETGHINSIESAIDMYSERNKKEAGPIRASVVSEHLSWNAFVDLLSNLIKVKKITLIIKLDHGNKETVHEVVVQSVIEKIEEKIEGNKNG